MSESTERCVCCNHAMGWIRSDRSP
ncbi:hypothetical protein ACWGII_13995 [Streptomyces sp. NPDC054855]